MKLSPKALLGLLLVAFGAGAIASPFIESSVGGLPSTPPVSAPFTGIQSAFCPSPDCVSLVESALDNAQTRVWVAMYSFTNDDLAAALVRAKGRGVEVRVLMESQQAGTQYSEESAFQAAGIPIRLDGNSKLMHHKFAVIDGGIVITGSMNWTANGVNENNENVNVIRSDALNASYASEFEKVWAKGSE